MKYTDTQLKAIFTSGNDEYATPALIYDQVKELGMFDPCPFKGKEAGLDGLTIEWRDLNFVNPPYSEVAKWVDKAIEEHRKNKRMTILLPFARTCTKWFKRLWLYGCDFWFITGRLTFNENSQKPKEAPVANVLILTTGLNSRAFLVDRDKISLKQILNSHYGAFIREAWTQGREDAEIIEAGENFGGIKHGD